MLLERDDQLATLGERLRAARLGDGSLVLIGGEAGAGKSSLVREFIAPLGTQAVVGACDPLSTPAPLSPLRDFMEVGDETNIELFGHILERFGRLAAPTVIVIEDIHWADQATLDFVRYVGRRVADTKLVVLCTYRDDEVGPDHPVRTALGQLARLRSTVHLTVPMLSVDAVRTLVVSTGLNPDELHDLTGGNAFFVTEIIAAGGSPPALVHDAVLARVGDLQPEVRHVIETISIAPRSLDVGRCLALGSLAADIDAAVGSGVVVAEGDSLGFRHELARAAVEAAIPPARRYELHRAMLHLLLDEIDPDHARLAHHAIEANAPQLIAEFAPIAARDARGRGSSREAVALFQAALDHADQFPAVDAASMSLELGIELIGLDEPMAALDRIESARSHFAAAGAVLRQVEALGQAGRANAMVGRPDEAMRCGLAAVDLAERQPPSEQLVMALNNVARQAMLGRRGREGLPYADRAARLAADLGLKRSLLAVQHTKACLELICGDTDLGVELLSKSVEDARELSYDDRLIALVNLGSGAGEVRRYGVALDALVEAEAYGVTYDLDASVAYTRAWLARIAFEQGRWDDAVAYASLVDATATNRKGYALLTARGVLGRVRVRRGDPGGAEMLMETIAGFQDHDLQYRWSPVAGMAEYHWLRAEDEAVAKVASGPFEEALDTDSEWAKGELGYWMWKVGRFNEPPPGAAAPFSAQMNGEADRAANLWEEIGSPYEVALARSEGPPGMAIEALGTLDALGGTPLANRIRAELRAAGVSKIPRGPSTATQAHPYGLTERQGEVLDLLVEGLSNSEIASRLYVSKKTVEHHVSAIYAKLGVESRAQAIAAIRRTS